MPPRTTTAPRPPVAGALDVVGMSEIAELLGVARNTAYGWSRRRLLPPPDYPKVNGHQAWKASTILAWARDTGRLPKDD